MLREMARRTDQLAGKVKREPQPPVAEIEIELLACFGSASVPQPQTCDDNILIRSSGSAPDIAQCPLAIADDSRAERGMIAAIGLEHPLHNDLAPLVLEIHVNVRRLAALSEKRSNRRSLRSIDGGNAEHVADG